MCSAARNVARIVAGGSGGFEADFVGQIKVFDEQVVAPVVPDPEPEPVLLCNNLEVTVNMADGDMPTEGDDVIRGTAGDDTIDAFGAVAQMLVN